VAHATDEQKQYADALITHGQQVADGLIPADSPPAFTVPQTVDERGLPWWFGPDYHPTERAIAEFSKPMSQPASEPEDHLQFDFS
jgi:hypothetical protein